MDFAPHNAGILLEWYGAMGVSEAIAETSADWFAAMPAAKFAPPAPVPPPSAPRPAPLPGERRALTRLSDAPPPVARVSSDAPGADVMAARELARGAADLGQLRALLEGFEG